MLEKFFFRIKIYKQFFLANLIFLLARHLGSLIYGVEDARHLSQALENNGVIFRVPFHFS